MRGFEPPTTALWMQHVCRLRHMDSSCPQRKSNPQNHLLLRQAALPVCVQGQMFKYTWRDLNPHLLRAWILSPVRLPFRHRCILKWTERDLNPQTPKPTDLQSAPLPITGYRSIMSRVRFELTTYLASRFYRPLASAICIPALSNNQLSRNNNRFP